MIPADCVLVDPCQVDESALTGERFFLQRARSHSCGVRHLVGHSQLAGFLLGESIPANRKRGEFVYSGSFCTKGSTTAVVEHTGVNTKFGRQAKLIASVAGEGHFERVLRRISYTLLVSAGIVIAAIIIIQFASGRRSGWSGVADVAGLALVLLIAALPVALQAVSTTTMALAARRLAADDGVICTKLTSIQDLAW